ncbi:hypothetical protein FA592_07730 [Sulfurospirillum diekertiae]|uniref:Uncharacterized protein n=1 Tax=Sulfurospirillum diekertiae TaxID=1854492 RepID=A0A6G9VTX9_9BACT|nr:hypothetical protein [Sulfurospirillum diekertiae]QIR76119.1 hypothetical protein FA584_07850 [Sulfurospirillum diekertiae]QIR78758.1 hypothetical protein FA592_07730 [Sulfurospirillum diekertiae]
MDIGLVLNTLRDPAGVPFYPIVFQALYILTWALHIAFVLLALGSIPLALIGSAQKAVDENWKKLSTHMTQVAKISVSLLIVLGVAPLLFTQVIYDANWYVTNTISGLWVVAFIYILILAYSLWYWFYYANRNNSPIAGIIGIVSFVAFIGAGVLMHAFANESIQPEQWMNWYAPNGVVDTSGTVLHIDILRLAFMVSLSAPVTGIFLLNYVDYTSKCDGYTAEYLAFVKNLGKKVAIVGLLISAVLFAAWVLTLNMLFNPLVLAIVLFVLILLFMVIKESNSYITTLVLVVTALLISTLREVIRMNIMSKYGYSIYDYPMNIDWPTVIMFLSTFVCVGFTGVGFMLTLAWRAGRTKGLYTADGTVTKLANATVGITIIWALVFLAWGLVVVFKNTL